MLPVLNALVFFSIAIITILIFVQKKRDDFWDSFYFLLIGLSFLSMAIANFLILYGFRITRYFEINAVHTLLWSLFFTLVVSRISGVEKLRYMIAMVILSSVMIFAVPFGQWLSLATFMGYYIAVISFFVLFVFSSRPIKNAGFYGQMAILISTFFVVLGIEPLNNIWAIPNIILAISFGYFLRFGLVFDHFVRPHKLELIKRNHNGKIADVWKSFGYLFSYTILLNVTMFVTSIGLHELGHLVAGQLAGCSGGRIVLLDLLNPVSQGPYTALMCPPGIQENMLLFLGLSGFLLIIPFGLMFLLLRRFPEKNLAYIIFGLGFTLASMDVYLVTSDILYSYATVVIGIVLICIGEIFLVDDFLSYKRKKERAEEGNNNHRIMKIMRYLRVPASHGRK